MSQIIKVQFKLMEPDAKAPTKAHPTDSGWDLYAYHGVTLNPKQTANVYTGLAVCPPEGWGYTIRGRSSLNKRGIQTALGTVDPFYSGKLYALLYNVSNEPYTINPGDRIVQIVFEKLYDIQLEQVVEFDLPDGARGAKGFGSSGV